MMPVGLQSAIVSSQISIASNLATHLAVQASVGSFRNAALLELADRLLGEFTEDMIAVLGVKTEARRILISAAHQRHAVARRQIAAQIDADLVATRLTEAIQNLHYQRLPQRREDVFELVGYVPSSEKYILLPIKLVPAHKAATHQDEWWARTAHPFGSNSLHLALVRDRLLDLRTGKLASNNAMQPTCEDARG